MLGVVACACNLATFLSGFSFSDTDNTQGSRGRKRAILYSTLQLPPAQEHWNIYLDVTWLSHIFNRIACIYQTATRWDLPPYRITISLTDDVMLNLLFVYFMICLSGFAVAIWHGKLVDSNSHRQIPLYYKRTD